MVMRTRQTIGVTIGLAMLLGIGAWFVFVNSEPGVGDATAVEEHGVASTGPAANAFSDATLSTAPERDRPAGAIAAASDATKNVLRVRLRGLHPDVPWTAPLLVMPHDPDHQREMSDEFRTSVAADGTARIALPDWAFAPTSFGVVVAADDALYQRVWLQQPLVDANEELAVDVVPIGPIAGRVVDARGEPVHGAMVAAFVTHRGIAVDDRLASTSTDTNGAFVLAPLPAIPLLVVAALPAGRAPTLPATVPAVGRIGTTTRLPDLVLADAECIRGVVRWADGQAIVGASVRGDGSGASLTLGDREHADGPLLVDVDARGVVSFVAATRSGENGGFALACSAGRAVDLALVDLPGDALFGALRRRAAPGTEVVFEVPRPISLHAMREGRDAEAAVLELSDGSTMDSGESACFAEPMRVRARLDELTSEPVDVGPAWPRGKVLLPLRAGATHVTLHPTGVSNVTTLTVEWRDGAGHRGRASSERGRRDRVRMSFDPGHVHLTIRGMRRDSESVAYLVPVQRELDVGTTPIDLDVPMTVAGQMIVNATDARGRHVPGRCSMLDAAGVDRTTPFAVFPARSRTMQEGACGALLPGGPNAGGGIPAGDYKVSFDFVGYGPRRERVTIRAGETTEVKLQLGP